VLFKRGDSFTATTNSAVSVAGPGIIGAYGTGANPIIKVSNGVTPVLGVNNADWRVMDLAIDGTATTSSHAIAGGAATVNLTLLRLTVTHLYYAVIMTSADRLAVVDSNFSQASPDGGGGSRYGIYCESCSRLALLGNSMYLNQINSHNIRMQGVTRFVIANSTQQGGNNIEPLTIRGNSQYGVLTNNKFIDNEVTVQPQNSTSNEQQHDIIFDRNWFVAGTNTGAALNLKSTDMTVRNNIFDLSGSSGSHAVEIGYGNTAGSPMTDKINIYNNTVYNSAATNTQAVVFWSGTTSACHANVMNNLYYAPASTGTPQTVSIAGGSCVVTGASGTSGNSSNSQALSTSPAFASGTPSIPTDYIIGAGSYAHNTGMALPIFSDFFGKGRSVGSANDMGATVP
jgi:hypothetical protein